MDQGAAVVHLVDEIAEHRLGDFEVGNNSVLDRPDGDDIARGAAQHHFRFLADGQHLVGPDVLADRNHGRFPQDNAFAFDVDKGVGGAQVNGQIVGKPAKRESMGENIFNTSETPRSDRELNSLFESKNGEQAKG